ncbi:hypothetical protein [Natrinema soli]|uniref:Uncharacterized protein n=1 Tax=Natrinema soli TaxID=1930624 RepID=A0ABD5SLS9_9EURY
MRFKPVTEPPADLAAVETVHRALPAAAGDADDCCRLLVDEMPLETREKRRRGSPSYVRSSPIDSVGRFESGWTEPTQCFQCSSEPTAH